MVVTPQSPHKKKQSLLDNHQRLEMVYRATKEYPKLKPSAIEFDLPQPNYTVHTLAYLEEKHPEHRFALIMGEDNLNVFTKMEKCEVIIKRYPIYVYPRKSTGPKKQPLRKEANIIKIDAPIMELSSPLFVSQIKAGKNIRPMLPDAVWDYLDEMNFYK